MVPCVVDERIVLEARRPNVPQRGGAQPYVAYKRPAVVVYHVASVRWRTYEDLPLQHAR